MMSPSQEDHPKEEAGEEVEIIPISLAHSPINDVPPQQSEPESAVMKKVSRLESMPLAMSKDIKTIACSNKSSDPQREEASDKDEQDDYDVPLRLSKKERREN